MVTGLYFATRETIQSYLNTNPMRRWNIAATDDPLVEIIVSYFDNDEDKYRWESWPGVEKIERAAPGAPKKQLAAAHVNHMKSFGVTADDDARAISDKLVAKFGRGMRLPDF